MPHGRQLRLFLHDGTSSGPRYYEIVNRTIQALAIPATRIKDLITAEWREFQRKGVYLVQGTTEEGGEILYIGKGDNVARRVQGHPEMLNFEVTSLLLFSSKDENLNGSQVGWLESKLIRAAKDGKRIISANIQNPEPPALPMAELATVSEFYEDLVLIAQTGGYDFFSPPRTVAISVTTPGVVPPTVATAGSPRFVLNLPARQITADGYLSDEGFVVKAGSEASVRTNAGINPGYAALRERLLQQGVLIVTPNDPEKLQFTVDYPFTAPSKAAAVVAGNNMRGPRCWKTEGDQTLADYLESLIVQTEESANPTAT